VIVERGVGYNRRYTKDGANVRRRARETLT
jgi:hypothetical protein